MRASKSTPAKKRNVGRPQVRPARPEIPEIPPSFAKSFREDRARADPDAASTESLTKLFLALSNQLDDIPTLQKRLRTQRQLIGQILLYDRDVQAEDLADLIGVQLPRIPGIVTGHSRAVGPPRS